MPNQGLELPACSQWVFMEAALDTSKSSNKNTVSLVDMIIPWTTLKLSLP